MNFDCFLTVRFCVVIASMCFCAMARGESPTTDAGSNTSSGRETVLDDSDIVFPQAGLDAFKRRDFDAAIPHYRDVAEKHPASPKAHMVLGRVYLAAKKEESIQEFRKATELVPTADNYHFHLAMALLEFGKNDEADAEFRTTMRFSP